MEENSTLLNQAGQGQGQGQGQVDCLLRLSSNWIKMGMSCKNKPAIRYMVAFASLLFFINTPQGDIDCGASSQADFFLNYFSLKFSISSQPGWQAGTINVTLTLHSVVQLNEQSLSSAVELLLQPSRGRGII